MQNLRQEFALHLKKTVSKEYKQERKLKGRVPCEASSGLQLNIPMFDDKCSWTILLPTIRRRKAFALAASLPGDTFNLLEIMSYEENEITKA